MSWPFAKRYIDEPSSAKGTLAKLIHLCSTSEFNCYRRSVIQIYHTMPAAKYVLLSMV